MNLQLWWERHIFNICQASCNMMNATRYLNSMVVCCSMLKLSMSLTSQWKMSEYDKLVGTCWGWLGLIFLPSMGPLSGSISQCVVTPSHPITPTSVSEWVGVIGLPHTPLLQHFRHQKMSWIHVLNTKASNAKWSITLIWTTFIK